MWAVLYIKPRPLTLLKIKPSPEDLVFLYLYISIYIRIYIYIYMYIVFVMNDGICTFPYDLGGQILGWEDRIIGFIKGLASFKK